MSARLHHVSIPRPPKSDAATRHFYGELLGLEEIPAPSILGADVIWFRVGEDAELHVFREDPLDDPSIRHYCLVVDDIQSLRQKLADEGFAPYDLMIIPGRPRFYCADPFGNIIEFMTIEGDYLASEDG